MSSTATFSARFVAVLTARNAEQFSKDTVSAINLVERCAESLNVTAKNPAFREVTRAMLKHSRIATAQQDKHNYIAVKVLIKLISTLYAMQHGHIDQLDNYTRIIGANLCKLNDMTNKSNYVCLSKSVVYDELDRVQALSTRAGGKGYTVGTASSQAGQVRQVLRILGIADTVKGKRDDTMILLNNDRAAMFAALYGRTLAEVETQGPAEVLPTDEVDQQAQQVLDAVVEQS